MSEKRKRNTFWYRGRAKSNVQGNKMTNKRKKNNGMIEAKRREKKGKSSVSRVAWNLNKRF